MELLGALLSARKNKRKPEKISFILKEKNLLNKNTFL